MWRPGEDPAQGDHRPWVSPAEALPGLHHRSRYGPAVTASKRERTSGREPIRSGGCIVGEIVPLAASVAVG